MKIDKNDYRETIAFSEDIPNTNWKLLLEEEDNSRKNKRKKK